MATDSTLTEADVLTELIDPDRPDLKEDFARVVLSVRFGESAHHRIRELLEKKNAGTISDPESRALAAYLRVGQFLDLLQAKARLTLSGNTGQGQ